MLSSDKNIFPLLNKYNCYCSQVYVQVCIACVARVSSNVTFLRGLSPQHRLYSSSILLVSAHVNTLGGFDRILSKRIERLIDRIAMLSSNLRSRHNCSQPNRKKKEKITKDKSEERHIIPLCKSQRPRLSPIRMLILRVC